MTARAAAAVRANRRAPLTAAVLAGAALAADVVFAPAHRHVPLCAFHAATGWQCPLCGGLRAADALAHLHWRAAMSDNLLLVLAVPLLLLWWGNWLGNGRRRPLGRLGTALVAGVAVAFTVVRNLPFATALRP
jgi:hypothetical protein